MERLTDINKVVVGNKDLSHEGVKLFTSLWALKNGFWFIQESQGEIKGTVPDVVIRQSKQGRVLYVECQRDFQNGRYVPETQAKYGSRPLLIIDIENLEKKIPHLKESLLLLYEELDSQLSGEMYSKPKQVKRKAKKQQPNEDYHVVVNGHRCKKKNSWKYLRRNTK